jgi:hypothetical protein
MAFTPGHAKVGGRRAGVPNKSTAEMRELAAQLIQDPVYQERLRERLRNGEAGRLESLLWQYACGRPPGATEDDPLERLAARLQRAQERAESSY